MIRALKLFFKAIFWFLLVTILWVALYRFVPPPITATMILDGNGITKDWMSLNRIDSDMAVAAIAAEDGNFCLHHGFDYQAIREAWAERQAGTRHRGGSTISQQTAKNVFLWQGGGWFRKGFEAYFTVLTELIWGKRRIMEVYLNVAETGIGTYGVNAGSMRYFDHDARTMSAAEAARIAAVLPDPKSRPARNPSGWTARYAGRIERRIGQIRGSELTACL